MEKKAYLILENGMIFTGRRMGADTDVTGEVVFTTAMTGYLETLTDPSYYGQIVLHTFPLIGNYGIIEEDFESKRPYLKAYIVREYCTVPSNFRSTGTLDSFLKKHGIPGICGIDTRALTKIIRESGVMNARILSELPVPLSSADDPEKAKTACPDFFADLASYRITNAVRAASCARITETVPEDNGVQSLKLPDSVRDEREEKRHRGQPVEYTPKRVVLWDFGAKANITRELLKRNCRVVTVPCTAAAAEIMSLAPDGVMLSNGPGDPAENTHIISELALLAAQNIPLFGICLGHQLLALSQGARTEKLKYGHRGANQPVRETATGRVFVSSQNHGYTVVSATLPPHATESFVNVNDGTCEGVEYTGINAFSVQFHPEASGGPLDTQYLFDRFIWRMEEYSRAHDKETAGGAVQCL